MNVIMAAVVGVIFGAAVYLLLRRSIVKLIFGLVLLSQGTNLLIFFVSRFKNNYPPLVPEGLKTLQVPHADPLPQALILTAIVISFGVLAFTLVLMHRSHQTVGTDDLHMMRDTDQ